MAFYRHLIQIQVLTEGPVPEGLLDDLSTVDYQTNEGDWVGNVEVLAANVEVTEAEMAELLVAAGSEPGFFRIGSDDGD